MTIEDFFTLTEMKDGLANLARVEELVVVMQKQKDFVGGNISDGVRQWSTVARTIAVTESKDCLDHFIQLQGLSFLNHWVQEAQKCKDDIGDNIVDELLNALLASFERLPIDCEIAAAFGVGKTVEQLLAYTNVEIKERARSLFDKWNKTKANGVMYHDMQRAGTCQADQLEPTANAKPTDDCLPSVPPAVNNSLCKEMTGGRNHEGTSAGIQSHGSDNPKSSEHSQLNSKNNVVPTTYSNSTAANVDLGNAETANSSSLSKPCLDVVTVSKESSPCPAVGSSHSTAYDGPSSKTGDDNDQHHISESKDVVNCSGEMEVDTKDSNNCGSVHSSVTAAQKTENEPCSFDSQKNGSFITGIADSHPKIDTNNSQRFECLKTAKELKLSERFQDPSSVSFSRKKGVSPNTAQRKDCVESVIKGNVCKSSLRAIKGMNHRFSSDSSKAVKTRGLDDGGNRSDLGLDCEIDALEIARQVAIEVEREVVDYREPSCSSLEVNIVDARSPDVGERNQDEPEVDSREATDTCSSDIVGSRLDPMDDHPTETTDDVDSDFVEGEQNQVVMKESKLLSSPTRRNVDCSADENSSRTSQNANDPPKHKQHLELNLSSISQEASGKSERNTCNFDLNEDASTEDINCVADAVPNVSSNLSAPIAVVATSKGAPDLPVAPLHFGGELGWRGSATTSAFRPASPRRTPDFEKAFSGQKRKSNFLEIDLNVAEDEDDVVVNNIAIKQAPVSSGLPSVDSSSEVSSRRAERLKLDLNSLGDEDAPAYLSSWRLHQNGIQSLSSASSSSSRQLFMRDFDLNDNPSLFEGDGSHNQSISSFKAPSMQRSSKLDEPAVTIMGSRVTIDKKDYANQAQQSTLAARTSVPFSHMPPPPTYGYNGFPTGRPMSVPPALCGPGSFPYMVDSRGAAVIPQVFSSVGLNGVVPVTRPPFLMSIAGPASSPNGVWSAQPGLDLNYSMSLMQNGMWEGGSSNPSVTTGRPVNSEMTLKRKEPDCGWEPYGFSYKL